MLLSCSLNVLVHKAKVLKSRLKMRLHQSRYPRQKVKLFHVSSERTANCLRSARSNESQKMYDFDSSRAGQRCEESCKQQSPALNEGKILRL